MRIDRTFAWGAFLAAGALLSLGCQQNEQTFDAPRSGITAYDTSTAPPGENRIDREPLPDSDIVYTGVEFYEIEPGASRTPPVEEQTPLPDQP